MDNSAELDQLKQQDRILEEIEKRLYKMKEIAEYASKYRLSEEETQIGEHKVAIRLLQNYLDF